MEDVEVAGWRSIQKPGNSLEADSDIDNLNWKLLYVSIIEVFVLHEDHVSDFETSDEVFD